MHILAIDTCFDGCSACVAELRGGVADALAARFERFEQGHAERLVPMIGEVMGEAKLAFEKIDRIAVTVGPGTFTGTRIGIAAARALALATGAGLVGVSSLAVMAEVARHRGIVEPLAVVVDARRDEVYVQFFRRDVEVDGPQLLSLDDASRVGGEGAIVLVGSGAAAVAAIAARHGREAKALMPELLPEAVALARLASKLPISEAVVPLYLRPPDAKPQDGKSVARA
ncbi:MAG: tRNA (adenosine(37)-N6)-threonylcarbamoyltransferase complex dimerization subunit type 1 TsaB [Hyphomicrobium sp.]|jgi:tRNA threonylcarbamoyladenosine biosynthesis protein TsaB